MDDSNTDRRKVTISEPSDKLSQDIQLKAEQILTDLRSLPLNYPIKRKRKPNMKNLSSTALNKNKHEDDEIGDLDDNDVTALLSDGGDDDSSDEYKETLQLINDDNQMKSPNRTSSKKFENIQHKSNLLNIRCDMLQKYIHYLEAQIVKLQREITDLSDRTSKASTKSEYEIDTLNTHLRISQNKIHDLLCEKEYLCKQLQDITHKLNISSQEKEELQKKMDSELLKTKQEKESEFMEIQTNLKDHKSKLNEIQLKYDTDIETLKRNHEVEIEKLKIDLKGNESLNNQLKCYINTLENCIYNSTQQKQFCNEQIQTDICLKPIGSNEESQKSNNLKDISSEPKVPSTNFPIVNMNNNSNLKYLTSVNKSTETSPAYLDNQHNPSLNEVNSILSKDHSDSHPMVYTNGNSDKNIGSKLDYNMSTLKNSMYPLKSVDSNPYFNDNMNKLIETQHHGYSPVSGVNGSFNKSPPPRLLHKNSNISPYENMKCFNNSENPYNQDGQFYSSLDIDTCFTKWLNAAYRRHTFQMMVQLQACNELRNYYSIVVNNKK
uniref:Uncharacterized protein n=1 Tax=Schistosoma haematobium TaxID=6185 RepID=A0A095ALY5_SCHHA